MVPDSFLYLLNEPAVLLYLSKSFYSLLSPTIDGMSPAWPFGTPFVFSSESPSLSHIIIAYMYIRKIVGSLYNIPLRGQSLLPHLTYVILPMTGDVLMTRYKRKLTPLHIQAHVYCILSYLTYI